MKETETLPLQRKLLLVIEDSLRVAVYSGPHRILTVESFLGREQLMVIALQDPVGPRQTIITPTANYRTRFRWEWSTPLLPQALLCIEECVSLSLSLSLCSDCVGCIASLPFYNEPCSDWKIFCSLVLQLVLAGTSPQNPSITFLYRFPKESSQGFPFLGTTEASVAKHVLSDSNSDDSWEYLLFSEHHAQSKHKHYVSPLGRY
jgi:hypothetical protein